MRAPRLLIAIAAVNLAATVCRADSSAAPVFATHAQAGAEYSYYVGALQAKLKTIAVTSKSYLARIKQDSRQTDLKAFSNDAKDLKAAMENENNALAALAPRIFLAQSDSKYFDSARDAAQAITGLDVDIARDLAAKARIDAGVSTDLKRVAIQVPQLTRKFKAAVLHGYRFFGRARAAVDMSSLMLKQ